MTGDGWAYWVSATTAAAKRWREDQAAAWLAWVGLDSGAWPDLTRQRKEYRLAVLHAYEQYRPNDPQGGECLPNEVVKLRAEAAKETAL